MVLWDCFPSSCISMISLILTDSLGLPFHFPRNLGLQFPTLTQTSHDCICIEGQETGGQRKKKILNILIPQCLKHLQAPEVTTVPTTRFFSLSCSWSLNQRDSPQVLSLSMVLPCLVLLESRLGDTRGEKNGKLTVGSLVLHILVKPSNSCSMHFVQVLQLHSL